MKNFFQSELKELRIRHSLTQKELGEDLQVSKDQIRFWESGRSQPNLEQLIRIAEHFDISLDELLGLEPIKKQQPAFSPLSEEENELLETYRNADEADKEFMLSLARRFQSQEVQHKSHKNNF